jgi:hypothetical protein
LHNKPQGLVNWYRKAHEKTNAKLISCYGQLSFLLFSLLAVNTTSYLTFLITSGFGFFFKWKKKKKASVVLVFKKYFHNLNKPQVLGFQKTSKNWQFLWTNHQRNRQLYKTVIWLVLRFFENCIYRSKLVWDLWEPRLYNGNWWFKFLRTKWYI